MMRCRKCPMEVRETLEKLRKVHDEQRAKMKFGSQKAFFARIWDRLHDNDPTVDSKKRKFQQPKKKKEPPLPSGANLQDQETYLEASNALAGGLAPSLSTTGISNRIGGIYQRNNSLQFCSSSNANKKIKINNVMSPSSYQHSG